MTDGRPGLKGDGESAGQKTADKSQKLPEVDKKNLGLPLSDVPRDDKGGSQAYQYGRDTATANKTGLVTLVTQEGQVISGRESFNPGSKESFIKVPGKDGTSQIYKMDPIKHALMPVDHNGQPVQGKPIEFTNIRSGHPPAGMDPHKFIGHPREGEGLHKGGSGSRREGEGRHKEGGGPRKEGEGLPKEGGGSRRESEGFRKEGGGPRKESEGFRREGEPRNRDGEVRGQEFGKRQNNMPDGTPLREFRRTLSGGEGGFRKNPGEGGGFRSPEGREWREGKEWRESKDGRGREGREFSSSDRADIHDRFGRHLGNSKNCSFHAVDRQGNPVGVPIKDGGRWGQGEGKLPWQGRREPGDDRGEHGNRRGGRDGKSYEEPGGRRSSDPTGRGSGEPGSRGGGGRGNDGSPEDPGNRRGRRWENNPSNDGVGGGTRGPRNLENELKGPFGKGSRGDFLPPDVKHGHERNLESRLTHDLQNPQARKALLDAIEKFQTGKLDPANREGARISEILKGLKPRDLGDLKTMLLPDGKNGPRIDITKFHADTQKSLSDMLSILGRSGKDTADSSISKNPAMRLLELLGKPERQTDRIPTNDQSRALMLDLFKGLNDANRGNKQTEIFVNSLTRSLADRAGERGPLPAERTFTLSPEQLGRPLTQDLIQRLQNREILIPNQEITKISEARVQDNTATNLVNRIQPEALQGIRADEIGRVLASRDIASKIIETAKTQQTDNSVSTSANPLSNPLSSGKTSPSESISGDSSGSGINAGASKVDSKYPDNSEELQNRKKREEEEKKKEKEEDEKERAELLALMQARKLKEQKDRELKDKEKSQEKDKKQAQKINQRIRYRIRQEDTLESIASKHLNDASLARLIYNLNKTVIPILKHNGKRYTDPKEGTMIWLPNQTDIEMFRNSRSKDGAGIEFGGPQYTSAEEELKVKFGAAWTADESISNKNDDDERTGPPDTRSLADIEKAKARRANIEKYLGPLQPKEEEPSSHIRHVCRLGDTLRGVALRHPALKDVELWKLIAEINDLSTETDAKGNPVSDLRRGTTILIPNQSEIDKFRAEKFPQISPKKEKEFDLVEATLAASARSRAKEITSATSDPDPVSSSQEDEDESLPQPKIEVPGISLIDEQTDTVVAFVPAENQNSENESEDKKQEQERDQGQTQSQDQDQRQDQAHGHGQDQAHEQAQAHEEGPSNSSPHIESVSPEARIVSSGSAHDFEKGFTLLLEIFLNGNWHKALAYDFYDDIGLRHEYTLEGKTHTIRVNPPAAQAVQLARNELTVRWDQHKNRLAREIKPS